MRFNIAQTEW